MVETDVEGEIKLLYSDDDIVKESKATANAIGKMSDSIEDDFEDIGKSADDAGDDIKKAGDKGQQGMNKLSSSSDKAAQSVQDTALEITALGETFSGIAESIFAFDEKLLSLERSQFGVKDTALGLNQEIQDFKIALDEGTISMIDQQRALQSISKGYKDLQLQEKELAAQARALDGEFISFGISLVTTVAVTGTMLQNLGLLDKAMLRGKLSAIAHSGALKTLGFNFQGASAAMKGATFSLIGFRAGIRATMLALGPIGIIMIAIGAAFAIWESNAFGVQEKLAELFATIKEFLPFLQVLEDVVKSLFPPEVAENIDNTALSLETIEEKVSGLSSGFNDLNDNIVDFSTVLNSADDTELMFANTIDKSNQALNTQNTLLKSNTKNLKDNSKAAEENTKKNEGRSIVDLRAEATAATFEILSIRVAQKNIFDNSLAGGIIAVLSGQPLGRSNGQALRNSPSSKQNVNDIRKAFGRGLMNRTDVLNQLKGTNNNIEQTIEISIQLGSAARQLIEADDTRLTQERVLSFRSLASRLGVTTSLVTTESETVETFANLISQRSGISIEESRMLITGNLTDERSIFATVDFQTTINKRNQLSNQLAYQHRQELIQNLP